MKGSPERQHLEEALKDERVGSPKIQALAHYAMLKGVEWRTENRPAVIDELDSLQLISEKAVVEQHINMRRISRDVHAYFQIPPDLVVKCQAIDIGKVISLLIWRRNIVQTSCRNRKWRCELLSSSEVHRSTTKSGGMWHFLSAARCLRSCRDFM
jgi:hypothetical protein